MLLTVARSSIMVRHVMYHMSFSSAKERQALKCIPAHQPYDSYTLLVPQHFGLDDLNRHFSILCCYASPLAVSVHGEVDTNKYTDWLAFWVYSGV